MLHKPCQSASSVALKSCSPCVLVVCVDQKALCNFVRKMEYLIEFLGHRSPKTHFFVKLGNETGLAFVSPLIQFRLADV